MLLMLKLHSGHEYSCAAAGMLKIGIFKPGDLPSSICWSKNNANSKAYCLLSEGAGLQCSLDQMLPVHEPCLQIKLAGKA